MREKLDEIRGKIVNAENVNLGNILDRAQDVAMEKEQHEKLSGIVIGSRHKKKHKSKAKRK